MDTCLERLPSGADGVFRQDGNLGNTNVPQSDGSGSTHLWSFDNSRVTSVANENRPVNVAVRYLIRARP